MSTTWASGQDLHPGKPRVLRPLLKVKNYANF